MFASLNVLKELQKHYENNPKDPLKGIIWHTQGSGKTALTGTPLLEDNAQDKATKNTFGNYLHTYSYAESIKDKHTLTLQLESIETSYKEKLQAIYRLLQESITIEDIEVKKEFIFNHERYIKEMLFYIIRDLLNFRQLHDNNEHLKAMVVCFSSKQAKLANLLFNEVQEKVLQENPNLRILKQLQSSLILHDEQEVKEKIHSFKHEDTDIVFVFNMLLTGFDLPNLKRLYIHRELKDHNLLQALARVNRPYNNMAFGYLIDFVGIQENFDKTTDDYLKELNRFNQSGVNSDSNIKDIFADRENLEQDIKNAYNDLFDYPIDDIENMTNAINRISEINELQKVSHAIRTLKERYNLIRTSNDEKILSLKEKMDIEKIHKISSTLTQKAKCLYALKNINEPKNPNDLIILEDLIALLDFKIAYKESKELHFKESEEITTKQKQAKEILEKIKDQKDKEIQKIYKDFSKLLQTPATSQNFDGISHSYSVIISQLKQHKDQTTNLLSKYDNDLSYVITHKRLHDRLMEKNISKGIFTLLSALKKALDERISKRQEILNEETTLKNAIKAELRDAFKEYPSLKDLEKEKEFITQTLFNELPQHYNQGNSHA
ncbi:type I restriction enzyme subunit R domain-containing protein [Helicobacter pylori]